MTDYTRLTVHTEMGRTPRSISILFQGEVHPEEMLIILRRFKELSQEESFNEAWVNLLDTPEVFISLEPEYRTGFYEYTLEYTPEYGEPLFIVENDGGETFSDPLDDWTEPMARSVA